MVRTTILAAVMLIAVSAQAQEPRGGPQDRTTLGWGVKVCGTWTKAPQNWPDDRYYMETWVCGFMTGMNMESESDLLPFGCAELVEWIDNYCKSNSMDSVATAAYHLTKELRSRGSRPLPGSLLGPSARPDGGPSTPR
jgi:hypothetical protein